MSRFKVLLNDAVGQLTTHPIFIINFLLVILSVGGEQIFEEKAFKCPANPDKARVYALTCFIVPPVILFICSVLLNSSMWRVFDGCCKRKADTKLTWCQIWSSIGSVSCRSLVIPSAWIFIAFMDGDHFICYHKACYSEKSSVPPTTEVLTTSIMPAVTEVLTTTIMPSVTEVLNATIISDVTEGSNECLNADDLLYDSQITAWIFLVVMTVLTLFVTCCSRCCANKTFLEAQYAAIYCKKEKEKFESEIGKKAEITAQQTAHTLFLNHAPLKKTWDEVAMPDPDSQDEQRNYYSSLHKWFDTKGRVLLMEEAEARQKTEAQAKMKADAEAKKKADAEAKKKADAEAKKKAKAQRVAEAQTAAEAPWAIEALWADDAQRIAKAEV